MFIIDYNNIININIIILKLPNAFIGSTKCKSIISKYSSQFLWAEFLIADVNLIVFL